MKTNFEWDEDEDNIPHFEKIKKKKPVNWSNKSDKKRDKNFKKQKYNNNNNINKELGSPN